MLHVAKPADVTAAFGIGLTVFAGLVPWCASAGNVCVHGLGEAGHARGTPCGTGEATVLLQVHTQPRRRAPKALANAASCNFTGGAQCSALTLHSCADMEDVGKEGLCPSACSYALVDPYMPCAAACVSSDECSLGGPMWTYPDATLRRCVHSPVHGCRRFAAQAAGEQPICELCMPHSDLTAGGTCEFSFYGFKWFFRCALGACALVCLWIVIVSVYRLLQPAGCPPLLHLGWAHWRRCLVSVRGNADPTQNYLPYPLRTNLHRVPVAGNGLCLYYNALVYMVVFVLVVVLLLAPIWVYNPSFFFDDKQWGICDQTTAAAVTAAVSQLTEIHAGLAQTLVMVWLCLLIGSLLFAWYQRHEFRSFDARTSLMADFAIHAVGFPPDAKEEEIQRWGGFVGDLCPLVGVSIAYDYSQRRDWVDDLLGRELEKQELRWWRVAHDGIASGVRAEEPRADVEQTRLILKTFRGSGSVFLVFETEAARVCFYQAFKRANEPKFRDRHTIRMKSVVGEPVSFYWDAFGTDWNEFAVNCFREFGLVLLAALLLSACGYLPATYYMLLRAHASGSESKFDLSATSLGVLLAGLNSILSIAIDRAVHRIGLHTKWMADAANMVGCVLITGLNTAFNLTISYSAAAHSHRLLFLGTHESQALSDYAWRRVMADTLWGLFMPGLLILPYLFRPIFMYMLSCKAYFFYFVSLPFGKYLHFRDLRSDPLVKLRDVLQRLEPQAIAIEFDFASIIVVHSSALIFLFFETDHMVMVCSVLLSWVMFTYVSQAYVHLRWSKMVEYTDPFLADCFNFMLAIPVSMVAAASAHWAALGGASGGEGRDGLTAIVFVLAMLTHWFLLMLVLLRAPLHNDKGTASYEAARRFLRYDYFNTNPVHVLKEVFLEGRNMVPFKRGKEYLQRGPPAPQRKRPAGAPKFNLMAGLSRTACC